MTNKTASESDDQQTNSPKYYSILPIIIILITTHSLKSNASHPTPPPLPILPIPTSHQISWQLTEMALFLHFGTNTFTNREWGTGHADPSVFNPTELNATQWVNVARESGFRRVILTAKHHDGFCLWPSEYTDYSVQSSPWKNGSGDVVKELSDAAKICGLQLGLYLSPWDRHESCYGKTLEYNEFYLGQMTELLTRYGDVSEIWLDGAKGEGEKDMEYFFDDWFDVIHQLQPKGVIFSDAGPDTRWVGDEAGVAGSTCWSLFNRSDAKIGGTDRSQPQLPTLTSFFGDQKRDFKRTLYLKDYLKKIVNRSMSESSVSGSLESLHFKGDPFGHDWVPAECDVSIRPGWFWHASELPNPALTLLDLYYKSVGRNCLLLLNVPPNSSGLVSPQDIQVLQEFSEIRSSIFSHNLAKHASVSASSTRGKTELRYGPRNVLEEGIYSYWAPDDALPDWKLFLDFQKKVTFNVLMLQEPIQMGQRIIEFHLDFLNEKGKWEVVTKGTTVGYKRLLLFPSVLARRLRLVVDKSRSQPLISYLGIYMDPFSILGNVSNVSSVSLINGSEPLRPTVQSNSSNDCISSI